jgi:hypothetical protein
MYFVSTYGKRRMTPVKTVLRRGEGKREGDGGVDQRYVVSTYVNIKIYSPIQLICI